jgi:hypothetical protein
MAGDVLVRMRADRVQNGDYLYIEDARCTVRVLNVYRLHDLVAFAWIGGYEIRQVDEMVCVEVMT